MTDQKKNWFKRRKVLATIGVVVLLMIVIVGTLIYMLLPRYNVSITDAKIVSTKSENGIKHINASIDVNCKIALTNNLLTCADTQIRGNFSSNKNIQVTVSGDGSAIITSSNKISFTAKKISIKPVVIRANPYGGTMTNKYIITAKNHDNSKTVLVYTLSVSTVFSNHDLSLINKIPSGSDIASALKKIDTVDGVCIVTENNDPNGELNKKGGYIAAVYFSDNRADLESKNNPYSNYKDICDEGTDAGGQIEVYSNTKDAKDRADYLSGFSGILGDGYDGEYGTSVVRISNKITATQINDLKEKVVDVLTK